MLSPDTESKAKIALVAFAKNPEIVAVKTRLAKSLGENEARLLYTAMLEDCLEQLQSLEHARVYLACFPDEKGSYFKGLADKHNITLLAQEGDDLGQRMLNCIVKLLIAHDTVFIFGTDVPLIPMDSVKAVLEHRKYWDVVIGPSSDGGYYLLGSQKTSPHMFSAVAWGEPSVLLDTVKNCVENNLEVAFIDMCDDIDDHQSLSRLIKVLEASPNGAAATRSVLEKLELTFN